MNHIVFRSVNFGVLQKKALAEKKVGWYLIAYVKIFEHYSEEIYKKRAKQNGSNNQACIHKFPRL